MIGSYLSDPSGAGMGQGALVVGGIASPGDRFGLVVDHPGVLHRVLAANPVVHGLLDASILVGALVAPTRKYFGKPWSCHWIATRW
jgi:hypothetical protein